MYIMALGLGVDYLLKNIDRYSEFRASLKAIIGQLFKNDKLNLKMRKYACCLCM